MSRPSLLRLCTAAALLLTVVGFTSAASGAPSEKVDVCHVDGQGNFQKITISDNAYDSHTAHGDGGIGDSVPGMDGYEFDENCVPVLSLVVTRGTGNIGEGVSLDIYYNEHDIGGWGSTSGGKIYSPSGAPDLFFQAGDNPTFPGVPSRFVHWAFNNGDLFSEPYEGAVHGSDNWMKVIRDGDGCVSWAQFDFDFDELDGDRRGDPILLSIPLYVTFDCADFTLAEAVAAAYPTP